MDLPVMVYDGHCGFCRRWIDYWRQLTGDRLAYEPFQDAAARFPDIPREAFEQAVHLITPEGGVFRGAHAVYETLARYGGRPAWLWAYRHVSGFAPVSEWGYRRVAAHRTFLDAATRWLWGRRIDPPSFSIAARLFARVLGLIYVIAFLSLAMQVRGLIGERGVLPVANFLGAIREEYGARAFWEVPTIFWFGSGDAFLTGTCIAGAVLAAAPISGIAARPAFAVLWALYLSLSAVGQDFLSFQWDALLTEAGFLAIFLTAAGQRSFLFRWLLFRLMWMSGLVKILSHDPSWRAWTALNFHYETQPLPTPVAWYMFHLPPWFQKASVGFVFFIELIVPFLVFAPRRARMTGAALIASLQVLILLTGNYAFFNWLALALCLFLLDDQFLRRWFAPPLRAAVANRWVTASLLVCLVPLGALQIAGLWWPWVSPALGASLRIVNPYGLFAMMTSSRPEIVIEGSNDGATWSEYEFRYKPGDIRRRPPWVAPHQPRLDWQMWFAALGPREESPWLRNLMVRLLQGSPEVLRLLAHNPFPGRPPRHVRAVLYEYHFTSRAERAGTGNWWRRETEGLYFPPSSLSVDARVRRFEEPVSAAVRASPPRPVHRGVGLKTPDPECSSRAGPKPPSFRESLRSAARHWATGP